MFSHTPKRFSILPSLKAALIQSFSPAHPIYSSLVLARAEQTGESVTLQAPSPLIAREAVSVGGGDQAWQQAGGHQAEVTVGKIRWKAGGQVRRKNNGIVGTAKTLQEERQACLAGRSPGHQAGPFLARLRRHPEQCPTPALCPPADLRLQLLDVKNNPYLIKALYGLLMLLPQSSAFQLLSHRLQCVPNPELLQTG